MIAVYMAIEWYMIHLHSTCEFMLTLLQDFLGSQQPLSTHFIGPHSFVVSNALGDVRYV